MAMKARNVLVVVLFLVAGTTGCGGNTQPAIAPSTVALPLPPPPTGLRVGIAGTLDVRVPGAIVAHAPLGRMPAYRLVVVSASSNDLATVARVASAHPKTHYALVGGSTRGERLPNLVGVVLRDDQAAVLGGVVAALVVTGEGGTSRTIAWVGPREMPLAAAFGRGAHSIEPSIRVLRVWSKSAPAACKEAALGAIGRGAIVVMARGGSCADAAIAGSHQANQVGLRVADFELPRVAAAQIVREAVAGVFHGGEDIVFGVTSGSIGVNRLDPRIGPATAIAARTAAQEIASGRRPSR